MSKKRIKSVLFPLLTASTLVAVAGINYTILHSPLAFIMAFLLFIHEFGHYIVAKARGAKVHLPYFIPIPFVSVGITYIANLKQKDIPAVAFAGPFLAVMTTIVLILFNYFYNFTSQISLLLILAAEIIYNLIGSDGQRYRAATKNVHT